ncbi:hypothetical protein DSO57_1011079 [Entomophthora muscae]|uniref:Uncharacterized protein n=1 Tax=Entomophthora muscae TaxID=34485 RepID=A0ACC2SJS3_9FUNG|nr:hypothetical protein DSO57_1011079 [Entomophthora muscae]
MSEEYSEREAVVLEKERSLNAELDAKLALNIDKFPKAVYFIIPSELSERFCFFGIKNLLNQYLKAGFGYESHYAKSQVHLFNGFANLFPLAGAAISDSFLGKYHTIVYFSIAYLCGCVLLSVFSINGVLGQFGSYPYFGYIIPALLITFGSGGIKPCLSAQGGDQFLRVQVNLIDRFYSFFYVAATMGILLSQAVTPVLKNQVRCFDSPCYLLAFGFPSFIFLVSMAVFIGGRRYYRIVPAQKEFLPLKAAKVALTAAKRWLRASKGERVEAGHWLRFAEGGVWPFVC